MNNKWGRILRNILVIMMVIIGSIGSAVTYLYSGFIFKSDVYGSSETKKEEEIPKITDPVNILITGVDIGSPGGESGSASNPQRTDTIMVAHYEPSLDQMTVVSIPRDTKVYSKRQKCYIKITEVHAYGDLHNSGIQDLEETVEELLGININYYMKIDYSGFHEMIDAIGGVTVTIPQTMIYDDPVQDLHINFTKGDVVTLDGQKAEEFFRWRKNNEGIANEKDGGDLGRIDNQVVFIKAFIEKVSSPSIVTKIPALLQSLSNVLYTNMDGDYILKYALNFAKLGVDKVQFATLRGDTPPWAPGEASYFVYYPEWNRDILQALNGKQFLSRYDKSVKIVNKSSDSGIGEKLKTILVNDYSYNKYNINIENNSEEVLESTSLDVYGIEEKYDNLIKDDFLTNVINHNEKSEDTEYDIVITLGNNSIDIINNYTLKEKVINTDSGTSNSNTTSDNSANTTDSNIVTNTYSNNNSLSRNTIGKTYTSEVVESSQNVENDKKIEETNQEEESKEVNVEGTGEKDESVEKVKEDGINSVDDKDNSTEIEKLEGN